MVERVAAAAGVLEKILVSDASSEENCEMAKIDSAGSKMQKVLADSRDSVGTTGNGLVATLAVPDTNSLALDGVLSAEGADVAGVLLDLHLLHLLTQGGTVSIIEQSVTCPGDRASTC